MRLLRIVSLLPLLAAGLAAETKLTLNKSTVAPSLDLLQVTVPAGERVVLSIPVLSGNVWFKDGSPIPGANSRVYTIPSATPEDSGRYRVGYVGESANASQEVSLTVVGASGQSNGQKLLTFTTRGVAGAGAHSLVAGFVVSEAPGRPHAAKRVLVRAVGPTLGDLGVDDFLASPRLTVFDTNGLPQPATSSDSLDLAEAQLEAGAYPLKPGAGDAWALLSLVPGAYTAQVTSGSGRPGAVLLEIYDLP